MWSTVHAEVESIARHVDDFRFRDALAAAMNIARAGNKYLTDTEPWKLQKTDPARTATVLLHGANLAAVLSIVLEPFLPFTAEKLRRMLGIPRLGWSEAFRTDLIGPGQELGRPEHLFKPITDAEIQPEIDRLLAGTVTQAPNTDPDPGPAEAPPAKPIVQFEEFAKLDLRVGTILSAEKVAKADKLLKLAIDIGEAVPRTVVSGIAQHFSPDELAGQQVVLVANLAARKMRGVDSQGMVLMAEDSDGRLRFVRPAEAMSPGAEVR